MLNNASRWGTGMTSNNLSNQKSMWIMARSKWQYLKYVREWRSWVLLTTTVADRLKKMMNRTVRSILQISKDQNLLRQSSTKLTSRGEIEITLDRIMREKRLVAVMKGRRDRHIVRKLIIGVVIQVVSRWIHRVPFRSSLIEISLRERWTNERCDPTILCLFALLW